MTVHTKDLTPQEKEIARDIEAELVEIESELTVLRSQSSELGTRQMRLREQLNELKSPFAVGDIVIDEEQIKYRVTRVTGSRPYGIRLSASGAEAHKDPRTIWSNKLEPVD